MGIDHKTTFEPPKQRVFTNTAAVSTLIGSDEDDPVKDSTRKQEEQIRRDLDRARAGIDLSERTGRINRGQAAGNEQNFQAQKEKEKHDKAMRSAMKEAQKALEEQLDEIKRQIDAINKKIEALEEDIFDTEKALRKEFGDDWKEKFKKGGVDKDNPLYQQWLLQQQQLDILQTQRDELRKRVEDLSNAKEGIESDPTLSGQEKVERTQELLVEAKVITLWGARAIDRTENPDSTVIKEKELVNPLQEKLEEGAVIEGEEMREEKLSNLESSGFLAAGLEGDGTYTKGIGEKGLSSQNAFNNAASPTVAGQTNLELKTDIQLASNKVLDGKGTLTFTG